MTAFILSVIADGERKQISTHLEEFSFFSLLISGKRIRVNGGKLELEGPVKLGPATAGDEAATFGQVQLVQADVDQHEVRLDGHEDALVSMRLLAADNAGEAARINDQLLYLKSNVPKESRLVAGIGGQTVFSAAGDGLLWDPSNAVVDILVWWINQRQNQDLAGGTTEAFRKISPTQIEFSETIAEGDAVVIRQEGYNFTHPKPARAFFRHYVTTQSLHEVTVPAEFDIGTGKFSLSRGGLYLSQDAYIGSPDARYAEKSLTSFELGLVADPTEVFQAYHLTTAPSYKISFTGVAGSVLTLPAYLTGSKRLMVFRNGLMMTPAAIGPANLRYTETSGTSITLAEAAAADDFFIVEYAGTAPSWRDDLDGFTTVDVDFTIFNTYVIGDKKLRVWRNGLLMLESGVLGSPEDRYTENGTGAIQLAVAATADEVFTAIYL